MMTRTPSRVAATIAPGRGRLSRPWLGVGKSAALFASNSGVEPVGLSGIDANVVIPIGVQPPDRDRVVVALQLNGHLWKRTALIIDLRDAALEKDLLADCGEVWTWCSYSGGHRTKSPWLGKRRRAP